MDFYHLEENIKNQLLDTRPDALNSAPKNLVHKAGEFLENKIADGVTNSNDNKIGK